MTYIIRQCVEAQKIRTIASSTRHILLLAQMIW